MIKKLTMMCVFFCFSNAAFAWDNIGKAGVVSGSTGLQYERSLTDRISLLGHLGNASIDTTVNGVDAESSGTGFLLEARYYFSSDKDLMEGWHIGTYYNSNKTKNNRDERTDLTSIGLSTGYQFVFASRVTADFVLGGGTIDVKSDRPGIELLEILGFFPHIGFTIGYSF